MKKSIIRIFFAIVLSIALIPAVLAQADTGSGLVGLWNFNDDTFDSSGTTPPNDGTIHGDATFVAGKFDKALTFDGDGDYVSVPDSASLDLSGEITVGAWIKVAAHKNWNAVVIKGMNARENYELLLDGNRGIYSTIKFTDGSRMWIYLPYVITTNKWHHIAMTYRPSDWRIYIDGVQMAKRTDISGTPLTNDFPLLIGADIRYGGTPIENYFNGIIDEVAIYSRALSASDIQQLYNHNEAPTVDDQSFNVNENSPNNTLVGTVAATDPDVGDTIGYTITTGDPGGAFAIDIDTGEITVADSSLLDFETTPSFALTVEVEDAGLLTDTATITVDIIDLNEAPMVDDQSFNVDENSPNDIVVGAVTATDPDVGDTIGYTITTGDPGGAFAIDIDTGEITVADSSLLDFETTPSFALTVEVEDTGLLTNIATITVDVIDLNETPTVSQVYTSIDCIWPPNHKMVDINIMGVTDPDNDPITIAITSISSDEPTASDKGSGGAKYSPDANGIGTDTASVRAERSGSGDGRVYVIYFIASDGQGGETEGSVEVAVPRDQSKKDCPAVDSGQNYDATSLN